MSFHLIGENRTIAAISGADLVRTVVVANKIYAYWRNASTVGMQVGTTILVSTSTDGITWTTPVTVLTRPGYDVQLGGVAHNGTSFYLAFGEMGVPGGAVTNYFASSTTGINTFGSVSALSITDYWACPSDLKYVSGTYYLAATIRTASNSPNVAKLYSSTNLSTWTSMGLASQLTAVDNVHPRFTVVGSTIHVVMREGPYFTFSGTDRILYTTRDISTGVWGPTLVANVGTGDPDIVSSGTDLAIIYHDQTLYKQYGMWSWLLYDGDAFVRRGTFVQGAVGGAGGAAFPFGDDFAVVYAVRPDTASATGTLFYRDFNAVVDEPPGDFSPRRVERMPRIQDTLENFDVTISSGTTWYSLTDGIRFYMSTEDFGDKAQVLRRITAASPYYEGTYLIHAVRENVQEMLTIGILGSSQNQVTENILLLEELVSQPSFRLRLTMGDHAETWLCQQADYTIQRGHINMHNTRAQMKLAVPRLPAVSYEVI